MADSNERAMIAEIREGNKDQFRFFVERYHTGLVQHLFNIVYDGETAEDIAQEAFLRAYQKLAQYNDKFAFSTWLYKIADNIAYRYLKQHKSTVDIAVVHDFIADDALSVGDVSDKEFAKKAVRKAIGNLPVHYRQVVTLYYWDGCSYEEIAVITKRPINTIRTWLFRAKDQLKKELESYGQI